MGICTHLFLSHVLGAAPEGREWANPGDMLSVARTILPRGYSCRKICTFTDREFPEFNVLSSCEFTCLNVE